MPLDGLQHMLALTGRQLREPDSYNLRNPEVRFCIN